MQSDFARKHAGDVAMAASLGYISTLEWADVSGESYGRTWRLTHAGMRALEVR